MNFQDQMLIGFLLYCGETKEGAERNSEILRAVDEWLLGKELERNRQENN